MGSKIYVVLFVLFCLPAFSQHEKRAVRDSVKFDEAHWNRIADHKRLKPAERAEFLTFQRKSFFLEQLNAGKPVESLPALPAPAPTAHSHKGNGGGYTHAGPCNNIDFELGSTSGWTFTSGFNPNSTNTLGCCPTAGAASVLTNGGNDPYGGFPMVFPGGGGFSLKIGDNLTGAHADRVRQTFFVTPANANFTYRYAVVLEEPGHDISEQPQFVIEMIDSLGAPIPCTAYSVAAGNNIPGFQNSSTTGVIYKTWTSVALDLSPVMGQNVTIQFTAYDCSLGGHFGYAYIDGLCTNFATSIADTTCANVPLQMCGPVGFATYSWTGPAAFTSTNDCISVFAAGVYSCETVLVPGCPGPTFVHTLTIRPDPTVGITPPTTTICFGSNTTVLTVTTTGGTAPFTYTWSNASNNTSVTVGAGTHSVFVNDASGCPTKTATSVVTQFTAPIVANGGPNQNLCKTSPVVTLAGTIAVATGGLWSGGTGTYSQPLTSLNNAYTPSPSEISTGSVQLLLTTTGNSGCAPHTGTVVINFQNAPIPNASADRSVCANNAVTSFTGAITNFTSTPLWSSTGTGTFSPTNSLATTYTPSAAEILAGLAKVVLTTTNNGVCPLARDTMTIFITPKPVVTAGSDFTICSVNSASLTNSIQVNGNVSGPTNIGTWASSGDGTFTPTAATLNPVYVLGPNDISVGTVSLILTSANNGNCFAVRDTMKLTIRKQVSASAGISKSICSTTGSVALTASITGVNNALNWSGGTGMFSNPTGSATIYTISPADVVNGSVIFTITASGNGPCPSIGDTMLMKIDTLAKVEAGNYYRICSTSTITLVGSVISEAGTGVWVSNGGGTFTPANSNLQTSYVPSAFDLQSGLVTFTLFSTNNGKCPARQDTTHVRIIPQPTITSNAASQVCSTNTAVVLSSTLAGGVNTVSWTSSGQGNFLPSSFSPSLSYVIQPADKQNGSLTFTVTSTGNFPCPEVTSIKSVLINSLASVQAGTNQILCSSIGSVALTGNITGVTNTGTWSSTGGGSIVPGSNLDATYFFSLSDILGGNVIFTLTSTSNGACAAVGNTVALVIEKSAVVNAGPDNSVCSNQNSVAITGTITGATTGSWSTTGTGTIVSNPAVLQNAYKISAADMASGKMTFVLTSPGQGACPVVRDTLIVNVYKLPVVSFNADSALCANRSPVTVSGGVQFGSGALQWSSTTNGTFTPSAFLPTTNYNFTATDIKNGFANVKLTSPDQGPCGNIEFEKKIIIYPAAKANFIASTYTVTIPSGPVLFSNQSSNANVFTWWFGDGPTPSTKRDADHIYTYSGYYEVTLIANNDYNCSDTARQQITAISDVKFPNAFTPSLHGPSDGSYRADDYSNDIFFPFTSGVTEYRLMIYNRWGELIFRSTDLNVGWDGYFNGKPCQQDTYVWRADIKFFDGRNFNKSGTLMLLR